MEANEGLRFLRGKGKLDVPLKKDDDAKPAAKGGKAGASALSGPVNTNVTVTEGGRTRVFNVVVEPNTGAPAAAASAAPAAAPAGGGTDVFSTFGGSVEVADILVQVGDAVAAGQAVAKIEAMKATHDIKAPADGTVSAIHVEIGDEVDSSTPIMTL
jgi:pyruvate carboxylase subunit B